MTEQIDLSKYRLTAGEFMDCAKDITSGGDVEDAAAPWIFGAKLLDAQIAKIEKALPEIIAPFLWVHPASQALKGGG